LGQIGSNAHITSLLTRRYWKVLHESSRTNDLSQLLSLDNIRLGSSDAPILSTLLVKALTGGPSAKLQAVIIELISMIAESFNLICSRGVMNE
jgi:hypothetical protein